MNRKPMETNEDILRRTIREEVEFAVRGVLAQRPVPSAVTLKQAAEMLAISPNTARKLKLPRNSSGLIPYEAVLEARESK